MQLYAYAEAREHYHRALDSLKHLPDNASNRQKQVDISVRLVNVSLQSESPEKNLALLTEAENLASSLADGARVARVQLWIGRVHYLAGRLPEAISYFQKVLAVAPKFGDPELMALPGAVTATEVQAALTLGLTAVKFFPAGTSGGAAAIAGEIAAGYPISLCVGLTSAGHLVAAHGIGAEPHTLIVNDPWGNKNLGAYPNYSGKDAPYDWPGYNNGNQNLAQVYWSASSRMASPSVSDTLVDDLKFRGGFLLNNGAPASMAMWKDRTTGYDGHAWYVTTRGAETTDTCYAVWTPSLPRPGDYEVLAFIPAFATATRAVYVVQGGETQQRVEADQTAAPGGWLSLGTHRFTSGGAATVRLGDATGHAGQILAFDAVRWSFRGTAALQAGAPPVPGRFRVLGGYPNPFNPTTRIRFELPEASTVRAVITNPLGQRVGEVELGKRAAGTQEFAWNAGPLSSGVYYATVEAVPERGGRVRRATVSLVLAR